MIKKTNPKSVQSDFSIDESLKLSGSSTSDCLVLKLSKNGTNGSNSALVTSRDCDMKAKFWCSVDVDEIKALDKTPELECLLSNKTTSTNATKDGKRRRKRTAEKEVEKDVVERADSNKKGKSVKNLQFYIFYE